MLLKNNNNIKKAEEKYKPRSFFLSGLLVVFWFGVRSFILFGK